MLGILHFTVLMVIISYRIMNSILFRTESVKFGKASTTQSYRDVIF